MVLLARVSKLSTRSMFVLALLLVGMLPQGNAHAQTQEQATARPDDHWESAKQRANERINQFDKTLASGDSAKIRDAALTVQKDPIAVQLMNRTRPDPLKLELNGVLDDIKTRTKETIRQKIADRIGVKKEDVTFFEAANKRTEIKVGQDWDVTVRAQTSKGVQDVRLDITEEIVHQAYYETVMGKPAPSANAAKAFAVQQAVEVTNGQHAEAYGGGTNTPPMMVSEGQTIIEGGKNQELRDPAQMSKAIEHKSNRPHEKALALEAQAEALDTMAAKLETEGNKSVAEKIRAEAREKILDAQGQHLEQGRQFAKQFKDQIAPRVEAMGGKVPQEILQGQKILDDLGKLEISPASARAQLEKLGNNQTMESFISKGAGLVEASQSLRPPAAKGAAAPSVIESNVQGQLELQKLEKDKLEKEKLEKEKSQTGKDGAKNKPEGTGKSVAAGVDESGAANTKSKNKQSEQPGAGASEGEAEPGKAGAKNKAKGGANAEGKPAAGGVKSKPEIGAEGESAHGAAPANTLNVVLNVSQYVECMQRRLEKTSKAAWALECLKEQAAGFIQGEALSAAIGTTGQAINFYFPSYYAKFAPGAGLLGTVLLAANAAYVSGGQLGEAAYEGKQWWDALSEEERAQAGTDEMERRNAMNFAQRLLLHETRVHGMVEAIMAERRQLAGDLFRLGQEQRAVLSKMPRDFEKRLSDYWDQVNEAKRRCENDSGDQANSQNRPQELALEQAASHAMLMVKNCKSAEELKQADEAWRRAKETLLAPTTDKTEALLNDVPLWGNSIKELKDASYKIKAEQRTIPGRISALAGAIKELQQRQEGFLQSFPAELIDMMKRNSGRLQQLQEAVDSVAGSKVIDPLELKKIDYVYRDIEKTDADIDRVLETISRNTGNFYFLVDTLIYDLARCHGKQPGAQWERRQAATAKAEKDYQGQRSACAAKLNAATAAVATAPAKPKGPSAEQIADWQKSLACLREGKRKFPSFWKDCNGSWTLGSRDNAIHDLEEALRKAGIDPGGSTIAQPASAKPTAIGSDLLPLLDTVVGHVNYYFTHPSEAKPLLQGDALQSGATIQTGQGSHATLKSPQDTRVTIEENSVVRVAAPGEGKQNFELVSGAIEVYRQQGLPGQDDVGIGAPEGSVHATGTRYRVQRDGRGTHVQVFEGSVHLTGGYIIREYAPNAEHGKPSPARELDLTAGQQALMGSVLQPSPARPASWGDVASVMQSGGATGTSGQGTAPGSGGPRTWSDVSQQLQHPPRMPSERVSTPPVSIPNPSARAATNPLSRPDPWNYPQVQQLIDDWLRNAKPPIRSDLPGPWHYTEWAQVLGPGSKVGGAPDHPSGWSRHQSLWAKRTQFDSLNLCTMGEFVERRIAGKSLDGCNKAAPQGATSAWHAPASPPNKEAVSQQPPALRPLEPTRRPDDIVTSKPSPQLFVGDWDCTITNEHGESAPSKHRIISDSAGNYSLWLLGGESQFPAKYVDGNRIGFVIGDGSTDKDIILDLEINNNVAVGTDRLEYYDGRKLTYTIRCNRIGIPSGRK